MKRPMLIAAVAAVVVGTLTGSMALADSNGRDRQRQERHWNDRDQQRHERNSHDRKPHEARAHHDHGRDWGRNHRADHHRHDGHQARYKVVRYQPPHGYRHYQWYRGARLPAAYYAPRYIVHDYHTYHLHAPPRGYHWVRVDNDVVLAAIATGLVMHVVSDIFY